MADLLRLFTGTYWGTVPLDAQSSLHGEIIISIGTDKTMLVRMATGEKVEQEQIPCGPYKCQQRKTGDVIFRLAHNSGIKLTFSQPGNPGLAFLKVEGKKAPFGFGPALLVNNPRKHKVMLSELEEFRWPGAIARINQDGKALTKLE